MEGLPSPANDNEPASVSELELRRRLKNELGNIKAILAEARETASRLQGVHLLKEFPDHGTKENLEYLRGRLGEIEDMQTEADRVQEMLNTGELNEEFARGFLKRFDEAIGTISPEPKRAEG